MTDNCITHLLSTRIMTFFGRALRLGAALSTSAILLAPWSTAAGQPMQPAQGLGQSGRADTTAGSPAPLSSVQVEWGVRIPMRDGKSLGATVYRPRAAGKLPVIFTFTPYIGDSYHERATYFSTRGYVFVLVDVRGRGNSDGTFEPMVHDAVDGYDAVEWLAKQPWSNGKVAMWGGSYGGFDQWATVKLRPPHLVTIVPASAAHPGIDFPYFQNRMGAYAISWLTYVSGRTLNTNLFYATDYFLPRFRDLYVKHLPFAVLDSVVGNTTTMFRTWLQHPTPDAFWDSFTPTPTEFAAIDMPILTIAGYYDGDQQGAMAYYHNHMRYGSADARAKHYLILGPWDHAGTRTPRKEFGGLVFGDASVVDIENLHREWYDWTMKDGPRPSFLKDRVAYYVPGEHAERWKYATSLGAITDATKTYYLSSVGSRANDVFASGDLVSAPPPGETAPDKWVYDPLDIRPGTEVETDAFHPVYTAQESALNLYGAGVVYHTSQFAKAIEITGWPKLTLYLSMNVPDTDIAAALYEIRPDGTSIELSQTMLRARYRESLRTASPVPIGKIVRYDFDAFQFFSRRIAKGSRLRLVVSSPNSIFVEKNYNSGGVVAQETARDARTAHITLYHDATHPSRLVLPIVE